MLAPDLPFPEAGATGDAIRIDARPRYPPILKPCRLSINESLK
jgi:hypothetical protein